MVRPLLPLLLAGCASESPPGPLGELVFVRDAVIHPSADGEGQALPGGGRLVSQAWASGETFTLDGLEGTAPREAECVALFHVELGDVSRLIAMGGAAPNTALAWSPGAADRLAVGTHRGELLVVDGWTGEVQRRRQLAETMVKGVAWSGDGDVLYAAEQSPDATLRALEADTLEDRWSLRLADLVETSAPPPAEDIYGVYTLPAAYGLQVLPSGELLVTALHSWTLQDGTKRNLSQVLRVSPTGEIVARWPETPADATFAHPVVDPDGGLVIFSVNRSADGPDPEDLPIGGVQVLRLPELSPVTQVMTEALPPHFQQAFVWEALDVESAQDAVFLGFGDGRVRVMDLAGQERARVDAGTPVVAGDVPIHLSVGWGMVHGDGIVYTTSNTLIPWGAASPDLRPPSTHPNENSVFSKGLDGSARWSWTGPQHIQGLSLGADGRTLVVGGGDRQSDTRRDVYGAVILDLGGATEASGAERQRAVCPTEGPVFFRHEMTVDGRLALAEHPYQDAEGSQHGAYRLTVMR